MFTLHSERDIAKMQRNIKFPYHYDFIPDNENQIRSQRLQVFLVFQNKDESSLAASTVFIKGSHNHLPLIHSYLKLIAKDFVPYSCPAWMKQFKLDHFNSSLEELREYVEDPETQVSPFIKEWSETIDPKWLEEAPQSFELLVSDYRDGDIVLFHCGVIHGVLGDKKSDVIRTKIYLDVYGTDNRKRDQSGFVCSDGSFKKGARNFENRVFGMKPLTLTMKDSTGFLPNMHKAGHTILDSKEELFPVNLDKAFEELQTNGVTVIRGAFQKDNSVFSNICFYFQTLMGLPKNISLQNPSHAKALHTKSIRDKFDINNKHLRRQEKNAMSQHIPKIHGITGYGAYCTSAIEASSLIAPLIQDIYNKLGWESPICSGLDISFQVCI